MRTPRCVLPSLAWLTFALVLAACISPATPADIPTAAPVAAPGATSWPASTPTPEPPTATARPASTYTPAPTATTARAAPAGFVEYIVVDEGFALALPDSWNVVELDERRFRTNMSELETRDEARAEFERSEGSYYIDHSVGFYGYLPHDDSYETIDADVRIMRRALSPGMDLEALTQDYVGRIESSGSITLPVETRSLQSVDGLDLSEVSASIMHPDGRLDYKYYLFVRGQQFLEMMVRVVTGQDAGEPPPSGEIATSFRWLDPSERALPAAAGAVILSNGLITETVASGAIHYDSTRDGFAITLPATWTEIPLRNGEAVAGALYQFATSIDDFGWPETSPSYLDFEFLAARRNTKLLWADSERKSPDDLVTLRVATYPEEAGKTLEALAEEAIKSIEEDAENSTLISVERFDTAAGQEAMEIQYSEKQSGEGEENLIVTSYYYVSPAGVYVLSLQTLESEAGKYIPAAREIAASFELTGEAGGPAATPQPAQTRRVLPTLTPTVPRPTPTPTIASPTPTPSAAAGPYDGKWTGTTSQGVPISLTIEDGVIVEIEVRFSPKVCSVSMLWNADPEPLDGNAFEKPITMGATTLVTVTGSIGADGQMAGTIRAEQNALCEPVELQWTASR